MFYEVQMVNNMRYETNFDQTNFLCKFIEFTVLVIIKVESCSGDTKRRKCIHWKTFKHA